MDYKAGILAVVLGGLYYLVRKNQLLSGIIESLKFRDKVKPIEDNIEENKRKIKDEEHEQERIKKDAESNKKSVSIDTLLDFFTKR